MEAERTRGSRRRRRSRADDFCWQRLACSSAARVAHEMEDGQVLRRCERKLQLAIGRVEHESVDICEASVDPLLSPQLRH
eukprot:4590664-Prymnesium_polylepis.1